MYCDFPDGCAVAEIRAECAQKAGDGTMRVWVLAMAATAALGQAGATPPCAGDVEISDAHIMRAERNGVLVMTDGRALHLEGIRLPNAAQDRAPQPITDKAFAELESLAKGRELDARAIYPKEDRYDRVRAQIFTRDGTWLQIDLLQKGLARVDIAPDRGECYRELYAAEAEARRAGIGLWADPAYATRSPEAVTAEAGTFQIVVGRVLSTAANDGRVYLNFGQDWHRDFTVAIAPDDVKTFKGMGVDPLNYDGKLVRVRGVVQSQNGPEIAVGNPKQIELLQ
jgi:endonuclease YncB( thermonuclease family)